MLIRKNDIPQPSEGEANPFAPAVTTVGSNRLLLGSKTAALDELIGALAHNETIHIPTRGTWSSPHLIEHVLNQIGPADCYVTSWSVKEQAVRILLDLLDRKQLKSLHCLFDERIRVQCPQAFQLAQSEITNIRLTKIHAKMVVLLNDDWGVSIATSANLTRNPRIERFVISTHRDVAIYDRDWIEAEMAKSNPFD